MAALPLPLLIVSAADPKPEEGLPRGISFNPTDEDLLFHLYRKVKGFPFPQDLIFEANLYGEKNPSQIWQEIETQFPHAKTISQDRFIITPLKKKGPSRIDRKAGSGFWEGEDCGKKIMSPLHVSSRGGFTCVGRKKRFRFERSSTEDDRRWIMHEYCLDSSIVESDYAICRIRENLLIESRNTMNKKRKCEKDNSQDKTHDDDINSNLPMILSPSTPDSVVLCSSSLDIANNNASSSGTEVPSQEGVNVYDPASPSDATSAYPISSITPHNTKSQPQEFFQYECSDQYAALAGLEWNSQDTSNEIGIILSEYNGYLIDIDDIFQVRN